MSKSGKKVIIIVPSDANFSDEKRPTERTPLFVKSKESISEQSKSYQRIAHYLRKFQFLFIIIFVLCCTIFFYFSFASKARVLPTLSQNNSSTSIIPGIFDNVAINLFEPFSISNPKDLGFIPFDRPEFTKPGDVLSLVKSKYSALPTNAWFENLLIGPGTSLANHVYQLPYIVDAQGVVPGIRTHPSRVSGSARGVVVLHEPENSIIMSAVEQLNNNFKVVDENQNSIGRLFLALEWFPKDYNISSEFPPEYKIQAHIARGSPYMSTMYFNSTPLILAERSLSDIPVIDGLINNTILICGEGVKNFTLPPILINRHIQLRFHAADMTWLVFFSEPVRVVCSSTLPKDEPYFEMKVLERFEQGLVRIVMVNNCTSGTNPRYCEFGKRRDETGYKNLIIEHADTYPTSEADIDVEYPIISSSNDIALEDIENTNKESYLLRYNWKPNSMRNLRDKKNVRIPSETPLLMFALPHHSKLLYPTVDSSFQYISNIGCTPTLHGSICPIKGNVWVIKDELYPVTLGNEIKGNIVDDKIKDIKNALSNDINFQVPKNYLKGAGDTYFSGKILSKLARIIVIAKADLMKNAVSEVKFQKALTHLKHATEIWLNGLARSPFLYDPAWGGIISCGCFYNSEAQDCDNTYPECPDSGNQNMNFGFSLYNDHHFHLGYLIYAAAIISNYDHDWAKQFHERVLFLIRDIANPSSSDPFFVTFRHTDWYLGFAWASGVVNLGGLPNLNGRNWESSSEAISAYEAVGLYGKVMSTVFNPLLDSERNQHINSIRVERVGRLLLSTCIRATKTYFHIQTDGKLEDTRIYPRKNVFSIISGIKITIC